MNNSNQTLADPYTGSPLVRSEDGSWVSAEGRVYPVIDGIPRFVSSENYAEAFGEQWLRFPRTQLDSHTGLSLSEDRLRRCMQGGLEALAGKSVLEAGCGAGRFTEVLLKHGAVLDSFDFSAAVSANHRNSGGNPRLTLVQADIRHIPFKRAAYDYVVCLGVVQHTPNSEETLRSLWAMVRPGGALVFDHYRWKLRNFMPPPFGVAGLLYRWYFLKLPRSRQFEAVKAVFDYWFPLVWRFRDSRLAQLLLSRLNPIVNYYPHFGLRDRDMYYEWMLLDTHDAMTDVYKHRRTAKGIRRFLAELGAEDIRVVNDGNGVEAFCRKPK